MKLIYVAIDGMGDLPIKSLGNKTPLEAAETPNMDALARNGKTGLMYTVKKGIAPESDVAVISLLGYDPFQVQHWQRSYRSCWCRLTDEGWRFSVKMQLCNFRPRKNIIDRRVARTLTTEEATELSKAANQQVKLDFLPSHV